MSRLSSINPLARAIGVFSAVAIVASGATFAALQSQATLTDNTISSATATLLVDNLDNNGDGEDTGGSFGPTDTGFEFTGLVPGGDYSHAKHFSLKNDGDANLDVSLHAALGDMAIKTEDNTDPTPGSLDKSKVWVKITHHTMGIMTDDNNGNGHTAEYTLAQLEEMKGLPGVSGEGTLGDGDTATFDIQVKLGADAVSGDHGELVDFDFVFTGVAE